MFSTICQLSANELQDIVIDIDTSQILMISIIVGIILGIIITIMAVKAQMKKHRPVKIAACADLYVKPENVKMTTRTDTFLKRHEVRLKSVNTNTAASVAKIAIKRKPSGRR